MRHSWTFSPAFPWNLRVANWECLGSHIIPGHPNSTKYLVFGCLGYITWPAWHAAGSFLTQENTYVAFHTIPCKRKHFISDQNPGYMLYIRNYTLPTYFLGLIFQPVINGSLVTNSVQWNVTSGFFGRGLLTSRPRPSNPRRMLMLAARSARKHSRVAPGWHLMNEISSQTTNPFIKIGSLGPPRCNQWKPFFGGFSQ